MNIFPKHAMVYRVNRAVEFDFEQLEKLLADFAFTPCGSLDRKKFGWTKPLGSQTENFVHICGEFALIVAKKEEKDLPASVINEALQEKIEEREKAAGRPLKKKEKEALKEDLIIELLPRAFSKKTYFSVFLTKETNLLVVDASSFKAAEDVLALLRKSIGSLPVVPAVPTKAIDHTMTEWVKNSTVPRGFDLQQDIKLVSILADGGSATFKKQDIGSDEIQTCINADKVVTSLKMDWQESLKFTLCDNGAIKGLKFADALMYQNADIPREDVLARMDADFSLASGTIFSFLKNLYTELGGFEGEEHLYVKLETESESENTLPTSITFSKTHAEKLMKFIDQNIEEDSDQLDELFIQARDHIAETRRASVSSLQIKFKIGYNRAARIMEQLEAYKIVSPMGHNGQRTVLITAKEAE